MSIQLKIHSSKKPASSRQPKLTKRTAGGIAEVSVRCPMCRSKQPAKLAVLIIFPLLLLCYGAGNVHGAKVHENSEDFHSLFEFKQGIIGDPHGALNSWNPDTHFCHWKGVNCTVARRSLRVTELKLTGKSLSGQISPSLGNLTFLKYLFLGDNLLQGVIPDALTNCSDLASLDLSQNSLTGVIPRKIGFLSKLEFLALYENNLTGTIPPALGNIITLKQVDLSENYLNGIIPDEIWHMKNIVNLILYQNSLSGGIPQTLPNIPSLQKLSLTSNMLGNTLPSNIGDALPNIQFLYLATNNFDGHIPASLGNVLALQEIDLSSNHLDGQIPKTLGKLQQLGYLNLADNKLEARDSEGWEFFHALTNCSSLNHLTLTDNQLQGAIPNSIANLSTNLAYLQMGGNQLSGIVPRGIDKLNGLLELTLDANNLSGTIEDWIGKLENLQHLNLSSNNFTGTIPPSIGNLNNLTVLCLAQNRFTGFIPPSLGDLKSMSTLNFSHNNFQGRIPPELGNFRQLTTLDLSLNKFSGDIPKTLGQFQQIQTIRVDQNILTGNIPSTFSNLKSLEMLNLSHNYLSGPLPTFLSDLNFLTKLDLSYNNFEGEIPNSGILGNPTIVSVDGNPGLCGGAVNFHMPSCHVGPRRVGAVSYLVKILIPIFGFMSLILLVYFLVSEKKSSKRAYLSQQYFGEHFEKVTYNDLAQATRDFSDSNLIGRGSYGSVYSGKMKESKMEVAVKVFDLEMRGAERSFMAECESLRSIQHRNLLPIITACSTVDNAGNVFKALVYELMPNGSLDTWLHHKGDEEAPKQLGLTQRINIAVNVADALDYLHHDCGRPTVHRDLKPSNILLDDDMNALLGDFGIARFYVGPQSIGAGSVSSTGLKGTIGYIPPEYGGGGHVSTSGDVYSFGIMLLEILTSKRPTDSMFLDGLDIISFVENRFPDQIFHIIDTHLIEECNKLTQEKNVPENEIYHCLVDLLQVALSCTRLLPSERPDMKKVANKMHAIKTSHVGWKYKK